MPIENLSATATSSGNVNESAINKWYLSLLFPALQVVPQALPLVLGRVLLYHATASGCNPLARPLKDFDFRNI